MKVIAFYLPQFYEFPENNKWWGKGFTEWTNAKKAKCLFSGHYQPKIPLNNNYYTLLNKDTFRWQIRLAKKYEIYGFCFYHYWFSNGKQLMEKPIEMYLEDKSLDFPFCLSWANHNWTRSWVGGDKEILMKQEYGDEKEWKLHFNYLLKFMKDERYIKIENKPVLVIYQPELITDLKRMLGNLNDLAIKNGLEGICFISQGSAYGSKILDKEQLIRYSILYEPNFTNNMVTANSNVVDKFKQLFKSPEYMVNRILQRLKHQINRVINLKIQKMNLTIYDYDATWKEILKHKVNRDNLIPGAFATFDSTPRRNYKGVVYQGSTPEKFEKYFTRLIEKANEEYKSNYIFLTAWNEWGEGAYIEPDEKYGYGYLEAVRNSLLKTNVIQDD